MLPEPFIDFLYFTIKQLMGHDPLIPPYAIKPIHLISAPLCYTTYLSIAYLFYTTSSSSQLLSGHMPGCPA